MEKKRQIQKERETDKRKKKTKQAAKQQAKNIQRKRRKTQVIYVNIYYHAD
jgi:hypothetical protein